MNIRQALTMDGPVLSSLSMDVQRLHAEHRPDIFKLPQSRDFAVSLFEEMLADPTTRIYIAEEDGQPVGYILCKLVERPENPFTFARHYLLVDQISVRPDAQGRGAGAALIRQAEVLAREWNLSNVQLDSWSFNTSAHVFFERMGYEKFVHRFWRFL